MERTIEQALQQGIVAHKEGGLEEAERHYRAILQSQPLHPDANHNLGVIAVSVNKVELALPLFEIAIEANPKIEQFWLSYIDALIKEKLFEAAKEVFKQAKKHGVAGEKFNTLKGQLASINETEKIRSASPSQERLSSLLGHYRNGRLGEAEKLATALIKEFPIHQFAWKVLGALFGQSGRNAEAVKASQEAIRLSPQDADAHSNLGNTLKELSKKQQTQPTKTKTITYKTYN